MDGKCIVLTRMAGRPTFAVAKVGVDGCHGSAEIDATDYMQCDNLMSLRDGKAADGGSLVFVCVLVRIRKNVVR
jgi:hypothetical protein